ncbi:MAG: hypothetical protein AB7O78_06890 [Thermoleophilia bacterium]
MGEKREKTPAEFTKDMPEDDPAGGSGAGPGAPETVEPRTGRPGNAGTGPDGNAPGGAAPQRGKQAEDADD